jgi:hypothetical protein
MALLFKSVALFSLYVAIGFPDEAVLSWFLHDNCHGKVRRYNTSPLSLPLLQFLLGPSWKGANAIMQTVITGILFVAILASGLLAGISLDKSLVQLPARHRLGVVAFADFSRAADLGRGLIWYPVLGIGAPMLIIVALLLQAIQGFNGVAVTPLVLAAVLGVAHVVTTSRAAPLLLQLRREASDADELEALYQQFTAWHTVRCLLQVATFVIVLWALLVIQR